MRKSIWLIALIFSFLVVSGGAWYSVRHANQVLNTNYEQDPGLYSQNQTSQNQDASQVHTEVSSEPTVTLLAVGDIMLDRSVEQKIKLHSDSNYPFLKISDYLKTGDIVFANLECPITGDDPDVYQTTMTFNAQPGSEKALQNAGITIVNLANNHTMNYGSKGMRNTLSYLDSVHIAHFGSGKNIADASAPAYVEKNGIKFAFLGYNDTDVVPADYAATETKPGNNLMDIHKMQNAVQAVRKGTDIIVVSMHAGEEYKSVSKRQENFAYAAIDAGADVVIGTHPHVLQKIEVYKGKYIFYSLGNFVFDQMWSGPTTQSVIVNLTFDKKGIVQGQMIPIHIKDFSQPEIVTDPVESQQILKQLDFSLNNVQYLK